MIFTSPARATYLVDELQKRTIKEEKEAQALESMVQSVEQNLELMTVSIYGF